MLTPKGFLTYGGIVLLALGVIGLLNIFPEGGGLYPTFWLDQGENVAHTFLGIVALAAVFVPGLNKTLDEVNTTLEELRRPLATADAVLKNTDATLLGKNAPVQQDLRDALQEVTLAARSLRVLMDYLERHPESLIRGKTEGKP